MPTAFKLFAMPLLAKAIRATTVTSRDLPTGYDFSTRGLFSASEQGIWLDPSDFSSLFQDAAGTTPVTALGQPVGLALDKRLGLALGPQLAPNVGFDSTIVGWNNGFFTIAVWNNGQARCTFGGDLSATSANWFYVTGSYVLGKRYRVSFDATYISGTGSLQSGFGYSPGITISPAANGGVKKTYSYEAAGANAVGAGTLAFAATVAATTWDIDNVKFYEVTGNHAYQTTSASRPTVEARVNLIIASSENIGGAGWGVPTGNTYTHNSVTVDGIGLTLVVPTVTSNNKSTYCTCEASTGISGRVISAYCKPAGYRYIHISEANGGTLGLLVFDSQTGTFTQNSLGLTVSSVSIGSGVYKFSIVAPSAGVIAPAFSASPTSTAAGVYGSTFAGDGVSGVYIGGIEIRNPADSAYPYQKVNTATDYVDVGAPRYLQLDGTDDGMATPSIDFTGTDKMTVWAGVRKNSDAAVGILAELSTNSDSTNGTFALAASVGGNNYYTQSRGTVRSVQYAIGYVAPNSAVLVAEAKISTDTLRLHVNNAAPLSSATDQGTGNYGNYPLYIGRRGGVAYPFNGRIYQLIIRGAESNAGQIAATEAWVNSKTRAY